MTVLMWSYQLSAAKMGEKRGLQVYMKYSTDIFGDEVMNEI